MYGLRSFNWRPRARLDQIDEVLDVPYIPTRFNRGDQSELNRLRQIWDCFYRRSQATREFTAFKGRAIANGHRNKSREHHKFARRCNRSEVYFDRGYFFRWRIRIFSARFARVLRHSPVPYMVDGKGI